MRPKYAQQINFLVALSHPLGPLAQICGPDAQCVPSLVGLGERTGGVYSPRARVESIHSQKLPAPRPRLPPPPTAPAPLPAPPPLPSAAADTNQLGPVLPRPVPGPPHVSPPPPAGGVPAADRRRPQPASAAGLPYPPPPSSKAAGGHRTRQPGTPKGPNPGGARRGR